MIKNCGNTQGDVDEEEDLCAVPPHIMRIMQVQNMSKMLIVIMVVTNVIIHNWTISQIFFETFQTLWSDDGGEEEDKEGGGSGEQAWQHGHPQEHDDHDEGKGDHDDDDADEDGQSKQDYKGKGKVDKRDKIITREWPLAPPGKDDEHLHELDN